MKNFKLWNRSFTLGSKIAFASLALAMMCFGNSQAQEIIVSQDSVVVNTSGFIIINNFRAGDHAGARLIMPCNGRIKGVQVGWFGSAGVFQQSTETAIRFFSDSANFPVPGTLLATVGLPVMESDPAFAPTINEFRFLDPAQTIPINIPVVSGQGITVTLEFATDTDVFDGGPNVVSDFDGCTAFGSVLFFVVAQSWFDGCLFITGGDLVFRLIVECDVEGACCFDDGSCQLLLNSICGDQGGIFQGADTDCLTANCPQPIGACCFPDTGECLDLVQSGCVTATGVWLGPDSSCSSIICPQPCPWDFDDSGGVGVADLLDILTNWGPCLPPCIGDVDGNSLVNVSDLLALLTNWGSCP